MTKDERTMFIEEMEEIGDVWEDEAVERVYGDKSLQDALADRKASMSILGNIIGNILRR